MMQDGLKYLWADGHVRRDTMVVQCPMFRIGVSWLNANTGRPEQPIATPIPMGLGRAREFEADLTTKGRPYG